MGRRRERSPDTALLLEILEVLRVEPAYATVANRIAEIERRHVAAAGTDEKLTLQRSAARMAFAAATDKGAPFEEVVTRFRRVCELGFSLLFSELANFVEFAHVCGLHRCAEEGLAALDQARVRLEGSGLKPESAFFRQQVVMIEQCRQRLMG
jgi:hypothetical protein